MYVLREIATIAFAALAVALVAFTAGRKVAWRRPLIGVLAAFAAFKAYDLVQLAYTEIRWPPLWDFKCFWMYGLVAASHHNVYDPASYQMYHALLNPTNDVEFNTVGADVGLPYPPPVVLLLYPLGLIANVSTAMTVWYVAIFGAIAASVFLLWRRFFASEGKSGLVVVSVLVLALSSTRMVVGLAQVGFFALLLLLLFWRERTPWRAGMWLAALIALKPLFILFAIYLIARRQWTALVSLAATGAVLLGISIPLLGPNGFATYILHNPTHRYAGSYFLGSENLYKLLVTWSHDASNFSLTTHPLFDAIAGLGIVTAAVICTACAKEQRDACLAMLVALGLFLYPSTHTHYCVLLLPAMCAVWRYRERFGLSPAAVVIFFATQYLFLDLRSGTYTTGLVLALDTVFFGFLASRRPAPSATHERRSYTALFATSRT